MRKALILILAFYSFALLQSSFFVFLNFKGIVLNLIIISVVIINIIENPRNRFGVFSALIGGFFLDVFSGSYFGFNVLFLLATSIFIKQFVKKYFQLAIKIGNF